MAKRYLFAVAAMSILLCGQPGIAQPLQLPRCAPFAAQAATLAEKFGENLVWRGRYGPRAAALFVDGAGKSWTVLDVSPTGRACVIGAGTQWAPGDPMPVPGEAES